MGSRPSTEVVWGGLVTLFPTGNEGLVPLIEVASSLVKFRVGRKDDDPVAGGQQAASGLWILRMGGEINEILLVECVLG